MASAASAASVASASGVGELGASCYDRSKAFRNVARSADARDAVWWTEWLGMRCIWANRSSMQKEALEQSLEPSCSQRGSVSDVSVLSVTSKL